MRYTLCAHCKYAKVSVRSFMVGVCQLSIDMAGLCSASFELNLKSGNLNIKSIRRPTDHALLENAYTEHTSICL
jgi:hypothetical protein